MVGHEVAGPGVPLDERGPGHRRRGVAQEPGARVTGQRIEVHDALGCEPGPALEVEPGVVLGGARSGEPRQVEAVGLYQVDVADDVDEVLERALALLGAVAEVAATGHPLEQQGGAARGEPVDLGNARTGVTEGLVGRRLLADVNVGAGERPAGLHSEEGLHGVTRRRHHVDEVGLARAAAGRAFPRRDGATDGLLDPAGHGRVRSAHVVTSVLVLNTVLRFAARRCPRPHRRASGRCGARSNPAAR